MDVGKDTEEVREELSIFQLMQAFPNNLAAEQWLERLRWPDKEDRDCPSCGSNDIIEVASRKPTPFRCRPCRFRFSVRKNTIMEGTNIGLQKWVYATYMLVTNPKGVASTKVCRELKISQPTAWFLLQRIREGFSDWSGEPINLLNGEKMKGTVEVDEAYIGGQWRFMHYERKQRYETWAQQKEIIVGMKNRETGQITAKVVPDRTRKELQEFIHERIKDGTVVLTDDHSSYRGMPMHKFVNHSGWQFVNGEIHVNGMENFWSILKRGYKGIYHRMSPKHLQRYINEFAGRLNIRDLDTIEKMAMVSMGLFGKRLTRRDLIAGKGATRTG